MKQYILVICFFLISSITFAQENKQSELYRVIMSKDDLLCNVGFNTCDISQFDNLLSEKFEFFHDKDGISDKTEFVYNLHHGLCKSPDTYQSRRELVAGSTEIYPLYKKDVLYGAVQTGAHRFYEKTGGKAETFASTAKFTNVWLLEDGQWKLARSFSYDHQVKYTAARFPTRKKSVKQRS